MIAPNITELNVSITNISEIKLSRYPNLQSLYIDGCSMKKISELEYLHKLEILMANSCGLISLYNLSSPLLRDASVDNNCLESFPFERCPRLNDFSACNNRLKSIDSINRCSDLERVSLKNNNIRDLRLLYNLQELSMLYIEDNIIERQDSQTKNMLIALVD